MTREPTPGEEYTDRYVEAATNSLPVDQRDDYAAELRSAIRDQIEDRIARGDEPATAEQLVLNGLGDPAVLSAGYAAQPLHLLGPRWYLTWRRVLRIILWSTLPAVAFGVAVGFAVEGRSFGAIVLSVVGITLTAAVWITTITTMIFVRLDRAGLPTPPWTLDMLPARDVHTATPSGRAERIVGVIAVLWALFGIVAITVPWEVPTVGRMSVIDPALWPWSLVLGVVLIVAGASVTARARVLGRWTTATAVANAVVAVVWAALIIGPLVSGGLFSAAFVDFVGIDAEAQRVIAVCMVVGTFALAGWSVVSGFRGARRSATRG